jgi:hypothetical protein
MIKITSDLTSQIFESGKTHLFESEISKGASLKRITKCVQTALEKGDKTPEQLKAAQENLRASISAKQALYDKEYQEAKPVFKLFLILAALYFKYFGGVIEDADVTSAQIDEVLQVVEKAQKAPWILPCYVDGILSLEEIDQLESFISDGLIPELPHGRQKVLQRKDFNIPRNILIHGDQAYLLMIKKGDPELGKGAFSRGMKAINLKTGRECILLSSKSVYNVGHQTHLGKKLQESEYFPRFHTKKTVHKGNQRKFWMIFDFCELGNLLKPIPLNASATKQVALDLAKGLKELHDLGYTHNDFFPRNVVLTQETGSIRGKIIDLGLSTTKTPLGEYDDLSNLGIMLRLLKSRCTDARFKVQLKPIISKMCGLEPPPIEKCIEELEALDAAVSS